MSKNSHLKILIKYIIFLYVQIRVEFVYKKKTNTIICKYRYRKCIKHYKYLLMKI